MLVGYDGSDDGQAAVVFGAREALKRDGRLQIVCAVDDTVMNSAWGVVFDTEAVRNSGLELLEAAKAKAIELGLPAERVTTDCLTGQPAAVLSQLSESASLVIVGRRAESGTHSMFVGSTAAGVAATAACPTMMVSALSDLSTSRGVIGVGVGPDNEGMLALEWAMKRAARAKASVRAISIIKRQTPRFFGSGGPTDEQHARVAAEVRQRVQKGADKVRALTPGVQVEVDVRFGSPVDELVKLSGEVDELLLSVHPAFPTYSLGGVVRGVMAHTDCTLGLIRTN